MTLKEKGPGAQPGPGKNGEQISTTDAFIVTQSPPIVQIPELDSSIEICRAWLAHLFTSDDDADQWRLAWLWPEYLRQRELWAEVVR